MARLQRGDERHTVDSSHWSMLARHARQVPAVPDMPPTVSAVDPLRRTGQDTAGTGRRFTQTWRSGPVRMPHRRYFCNSEKRGDEVGATRRGKGTKVMAVADRAGLPVAVHVASASPHEVTLAEETVAKCFVADENPARLIGDKAYDSDQLDYRLAAEYGIEMIAPHRLVWRKREKTQDGRTLRRYKRRWKIERLFAWLQNFRRIQVRYDYYSQNYLGFVKLGCMIILLRRCL